MKLTKEQAKKQFPDVTFRGEVSLGNDVSLGNGVRLGNWVRLGNGVRLGDRVSLGNWVSLGNDVSLGDGVRLGNDVSLGDGVRLGDRVRLSDGVSLGNDVSLGDDVIIASVIAKYVGTLVINTDTIEIRIGCEVHNAAQWDKDGASIACKYGESIWWQETGKAMLMFLKNEATNYLKGAETK